MRIKDWPDVPNRAILWSYRQAARSSAKTMSGIIVLLSKLRINMIHLVVDCIDYRDRSLTNNRDGQNQAQAPTRNDGSREGPDGPDVGPDGREEEEEEEDNSIYNSANVRGKTLFALLEVCSRYAGKFTFRGFYGSYIGGIERL